MQLKTVTIYTDGGCRGNPGVGAWAAILQYLDKTLEISGAEHKTTNNRMELTAVIKALEALKFKCHVELFTDSKYVQQGITEWISGWQSHDWHGSNGKPVKNQDLWQMLLEASSKHDVTWNWVKGHANDALNERADLLVNMAMDKIAQGDQHV